MAELRAVTAIREPEFEGFVASTLFAHGWSVIYRALDRTSLIANLRVQNPSKPLLIYSSDIPGFDSTFLDEVSPHVERTIGFSSTSADLMDSTLIAKPELAIDLISIIRTPNRSPLIRKNQIDRNSKRAFLIAIGGACHGDGVTTAAINLAIELTLLGKKVLLVDAHVHQPAIATLLSERNINQELPRTINSNLNLFEVTRANAPSLHHIICDYSLSSDFIIFDIGTIPAYEQEIVEKRWDGVAYELIAENIDELWILTSPSKVSAAALAKISHDGTTRLRGLSTTFILNHRQKGRRGDIQEERFLSIVTSLQPRAVRVLSSDPGALERARSERSILMENNPRSLLRREITAIARGLLERSENTI